MAGERQKRQNGPLMDRQGNLRVVRACGKHFGMLREFLTLMAMLGSRLVFTGSMAGAVVWTQSSSSSYPLGLQSLVSINPMVPCGTAFSGPAC